MGEGDDTVDDGPVADVLQFGVVEGGKSNDAVSEDCAESLQLMDAVREQVVEGSVTSMFLFALTADGSLTRLILSKNRFELAGLALEIAKMIDEEGLS